MLCYEYWNIYLYVLFELVFDVKTSKAGMIISRDRYRLLA